MKLSALLITLMLAAAAHAQTPAPQAPAAVPEAELPPLSKIDVKIGTGAEADIGKTVVVNYTGWLYKPLALNRRGKQFDSSVGRGPFDFVLGAGKVIKGWDQGIVGMKVGGKRTLVIPAHLAYGKRGSGPMIGPDADLIFDVELLEVK